MKNNNISYLPVLSRNCCIYRNLPQRIDPRPHAYYPYIPPYRSIDIRAPLDGWHSEKSCHPHPCSLNLLRTNLYFYRTFIFTHSLKLQKYHNIVTDIFKKIHLIIIKI